MTRPIITLKKKTAEPEKAKKMAAKQKVKFLTLELLADKCPVFHKRQLLSVGIHEKIHKTTQYSKVLIADFLTKYVAQDWYQELIKQKADRFDVLGKNVGKQEEKIAKILKAKELAAQKRKAKEELARGLSA